MASSATLGLALLVYTPMAYLLLRAGYRRRMWVGAAIVSLLAVAPGLGDALAGVGGGSLLATGAIAGWLVGFAALGFRPLVREAPYSGLITAGQLGVVTVVTRLLASAVFPLSPPALTETDPTTLAVTFATRSPPEELSLAAADLHTSLLAVSVLVFLVSVGSAHVHGEPDHGDSDPARRGALRRSS